MSKIKYFVEQSWLLIVSSIFFGGLLALTSAAWGPRIRQNEIEKFNRLARTLLPQAQSFVPLDRPVEIPSGGGRSESVEVKKGVDENNNTVGWAFLCQGSGFADKIKLVVAADAQFENLAGFGVLFSNETPGFGDKITIPGGFFQSQFAGAPAKPLDLVKSGDAKKIDTEIVAISGATVSSQAVVDILNTYIVPIREELTKRGLIE